MSAQDTPRAFPSVAVEDAFGGMALRDWLAGQALSGMMASEDGDGAVYTSDYAAERAYKLANAMMAQRALPRASDGQGEG